MRVTPPNPLPHWRTNVASALSNGTQVVGQGKPGPLSRVGRYTSGTEKGAQGGEGIVRPRFPPETVRMVPAWPPGLPEPLAADALMIWTFLRARAWRLVQ